MYRKTYIDIRHINKYLNVDTFYIHRLIKAGLIRSMRVGGIIKVSYQDLLVLDVKMKQLENVPSDESKDLHVVDSIGVLMLSNKKAA